MKRYRITRNVLTDGRTDNGRPAGRTIRKQKPLAVSAEAKNSILGTILFVFNGIDICRKC